MLMLVRNIIAKRVLAWIVAAAGVSVAAGSFSSGASPFAPALERYKAEGSEIIRRSIDPTFEKLIRALRKPR